MEIKSLSNNVGLISQVAGWYYDEWFESFSDISKRDLEKAITDKVTSGSTIPHFYIMLEGEELIGVVELKFRENRNHPQYVHWLGGLYVHSNYRHQRVASRLIEHVLLEASKLGVSELYLQCEKPLVRFYENHGFVHLHSSRHRDIETEIMVAPSVDASRR